VIVVNGSVLPKYCASFVFECSKVVKLNNILYIVDKNLDSFYSIAA